jgi:hypothetical protein
MFEYSPTLVTACCDPDQGKAKEDIFEQPHVPDMIIGPPHTPAGTSPIAVALLSVRECVEPKLYRAAPDSAQAPKWQSAMQHECCETWFCVVIKLLHSNVASLVK